MKTSLLLLAFIASVTIGHLGDLPDPKLTPGAVNPDATVEDLQNPEFIKQARHVSDSTKRKVFEEYGITDRSEWKNYEVDHLISLELGGSNDLKNLWPQSYLTHPWNARVKDRLENHLHRLVTSGKLPLEQAQQEISEDWIACYQKHLGEPKE